MRSSISFLTLALAFAASACSSEEGATTYGSSKPDSGSNKDSSRSDSDTDPDSDDHPDTAPDMVGSDAGIDSAPSDSPLEQDSTVPPDSPVEQDSTVPPDSPVEQDSTVPPDSPVEQDSTVPPDSPVEQDSTVPPDSPVDAPPVMGPCMDLAENNPDEWLSGGEQSTTTLSVESLDTVHGTALKAETSAPFDWYLRYPKTGGQRWVLSQYDKLTFSIRAENANSWQGNFPVVVLEDATGARMQFTPDTAMLSPSWTQITVPLLGGAGWTTQGTVDLSQIQAFEIHADTWDAGFTVWIDDVQVARDDNTCPQGCESACDATSETCDLEGPIPACKCKWDLGGNSCSCGTPETAMKVIVVAYDPIMATMGNRPLHEAFGWNDPHVLNRQVRDSLCEVSGGKANYQVVDFIDIHSFPVKRDGFQYTESSFLAMLPDPANLAHQPDSISYEAIFTSNNLVQRIIDEDIREIWLWGAPYMGFDEYAMKLPDDLIYYPVTNPWFYRPYDIPDVGRTVWVMGWNYERAQAEAVHSYGHRMEGILSLTVGEGHWDNLLYPDNIWNRFTQQVVRNPDDIQVGNIHYPPNGTSDYDYGNQTTVMSAADDWFNYPNLTNAKQPVNAETWGGPDYQLNFLKWWMNHVPRADGVTGGVFNNWWRYVVDYDQAVAQQPPPGGVLHVADTAMW